MTRTKSLLVAALLLAPAVLVAQQPAPKPAAAARMAKEEATEAQLMKEAKVSEAAARVTALKAVPGGVVKDHELERENGKLIWSYDIAVAGKSGIEEVAVDAMTGAMLSRVHETPADEKKEAAEDVAKAKAAGKMQKEEATEAQLMKEAKVSEAAARVTALKAVPGGVVKDHELERENGKLIWSYDITVAGKSGIEEVAIDAMTGAMLSRVHETPADEKKEAAEDAAKARAKAAAGAKKP